ncbi:MAG: hypothetical protein C0601_04695 [Candidatus Muiribacterium halophilum]|uniref:Uncharacterized protein n=1 Tax=Muiribacterium halophilum TaxID=2053465 RepID=A0A2N5ZI20_MUIH1|nr:MAG: hypothetical protein C0601_04695 [Candidatus Muirbacterium halophilum]
MSYFIDEDDLDLDIEESFELDLEIDDLDDLDLDDDSPVVKNDQNSNLEVFMEKLPDDVNEFLDDELKNRIQQFIDNDEKMNDVKGEFLGLFNKNMEEFVLLKFPFGKDPVKTTFYRFFYIDKRLLDDEKMSLLNEIEFDKAVFDENEKYPVYYQDEWLEFVGKGKISISAGDDVSEMGSSKKDPGMIKAKYQKELKITKKNLDNMIKMRDDNINLFEQESKKIIANKGYDAIDLSTSVAKINQYVGTINNIGMRARVLKKKQEKLEKEISMIKVDVSEDEANTTEVMSEYNTLREMCKICVGPRGNHFPFLVGEFFTPFLLDRKKVKDILDDYFNLLPGFFYRKFMGIESEKVPYVGLMPCYGNNGFCWDPIDPENKESGRGKMLLPLYSQTKPEELVAQALADYYWNKNKTSAGARWLEEGITGKYYMWHQDIKTQKKKGKDVKCKVIPDLKESFVFHFKQYLLEERIARAKLPKEVRQIFWLNIPFDRKTKEDLAERGFHYKNLWENDQRRGA